MSALMLLTGAGLFCELHAASPDAKGDTYLPWEGGSAYYKQWTNGPSSDPGFFPISVWLQDPRNAARYAAIGVNQYIALPGRASDESLATLAQAGITVFVNQSKSALASPKNSVIRGWFLYDEPDNAQDKPGGGYGPCILPPVMFKRYEQVKAADATRPAYLNFGQTVAYENWVGRGEACAGHDEHYPQYIKGTDIVSFDIYPVNTKLPLWWVGKGIDRLRVWAEYRKPVWDWIETSAFNAGPKPTPADVRSEVWLSIIHGAMGIGYFCHQFKPVQNDAAPLDDPPMREALAAINAQIKTLAPVLNTRSISNGVTVSSSNADSPVDVMLKRQGGATYLLAAGARPGGETTAAFKLRGCPKNLTATVLGESRTVKVSGGVLQDHFSNYEVHLYQLPFLPEN
jgi:hypothetical protein